MAQHLIKQKLNGLSTNIQVIYSENLSRKEPALGYNLYVNFLIFNCSLCRKYFTFFFVKKYDILRTMFDNIH
jgi:hypothetical protein